MPRKSEVPANGSRLFLNEGGCVPPQASLSYRSGRFSLACFRSVCSKSVPLGKHKTKQKTHSWTFNKSWNPPCEFAAGPSSIAPVYKSPKKVHLTSCRLKCGHFADARNCQSEVVGQVPHPLVEFCERKEKAGASVRGALYGRPQDPRPALLEGLRTCFRGTRQIAGCGFRSVVLECLWLITPSLVLVV